MRFVKLTACKGDNFYVNVDLIASVEPSNIASDAFAAEVRSRLYTTQDHEFWCMETPEQVMDKIFGKGEA